MLATTRVRLGTQLRLSRSIATSRPRALASEAHPSVVVKAQPWANPYPEDQFSVHRENGFLPKQDPLIKLPAEYTEMESLLDRMRVQKLDGTPGLLATGDFGAACNSELPQYDLSKVTDPRLLNGE